MEERGRSMDYEVSEWHTPMFLEGDVAMKVALRSLIISIHLSSRIVPIGRFGVVCGSWIDTF